MSYQIKITPLAEMDIDEAMTWYEGQRSGVGIDFLLKFYDATAFLKEAPTLYPEVHRSFRRTIMKKYPYAVYYTIEEKQVIVLAVWHMRQNPDKLKSRLK